jgi:hypothetical protein
VASPVRVSQAVDSPIDAELERLNANIPLPNKRTSFDGVPVNFRAWPEVWTELRRLEGNELKHPAFCNGPPVVNPFLRFAGRRGLASVRGRRPGEDGAAT